MIIRFGRLRLSLTVLPRIPQGDDTPEFKPLTRRLALRHKRHAETRSLERKRALAKFGAAQ